MHPPDGVELHHVDGQLQDAAHQNFGEMYLQSPLNAVQGVMDAVAGGQVDDPGVWELKMPGVTPTGRTQAEVQPTGKRTVRV
jgi:hypothetical protein